MRWQAITHRQQQHPSDCLSTCAAMVLDQLGHKFSYRKLYRLLKIGESGTPFRNLRYLSKWKVDVQFLRGTIELLKTLCDEGKLPIVFVRTGELPYWNENVSHALVVVGVDDTNVYVHDPVFPDAPKSVFIGDFDLAWLLMDEKFALLSKD